VINRRKSIAKKLLTLIALLVSFGTVASAQQRPLLT